LGEHLDRGGLHFGRLARGQTGEQGSLSGLKRRDIKEGESCEAVGERRLCVGGGRGSARENGGEFAGGVGRGDGGVCAAQTVTEGAESGWVGARLRDEVDECGALAGGTGGGADLNEFSNKRGRGLRGGEVAREGR